MLKPALKKYLPGLLLLLGTIVLTTLAVNRFRLPGQSNLIESMAMDMNAMKPEPGAAPVATAKVVLRRVQPELSYSGTIRGLNEISLAARIEGTLSSVTVYAGARVSRGQLLATLAAPELGARTSTAEAERLEAQAELGAISQEANRLKAEEQAATAGIGEARAGLTAAEATLKYWRERLPRERELLEAGGIALEEYQRYQADYSIAEAEVSAARQRVRVAESEKRARTATLGENAARRRAQQASIARAGAGLRERQVQQGFTRLTAPVSGVVTERLLAPGSVVGVGTPILTLAQIDSVRVQIRVPERDAAGLKAGGLLTLSPAAHPDDEIEANITSIAPASGSGTRTQIVEAIVPNAEGRLLPGQYVKARLRSGEDAQAQPAIPERAILQLAGSDSVWTVRNGRAHLSEVTVEAVSGDWAIVDLDKGTEVITDGYESLTEGMAVTPVRWTANGPERLPEAGGANRLGDSNQWALQAALAEGILLKISISPKPPVSGQNTISFELLHTSGTGQHALTDARIRLATSMPAMNMGGPELNAAHQGQGRYTASFSGMSGLWQVVATIETGGKRLRPYTFEFNLP